MSDADLVRTTLENGAELYRQVASERAEIVARAAQVIVEALNHGGQVLVFGNGGSAADAQHFATEMVGRFITQRRALPAVALNTDGALMTAVANDLGYDQVFARQLDALGRKGDVAMAITTSGNSASVNVALRAARAKGLITVGLTGRNGGESGQLVDVHVNVPGTNTQRIQEAQTAILHVICELVERHHA